MSAQGTAHFLETMNPVILGISAFGCIFGSAWFGTRLRAALPEHHLSSETKDAVRIGMGLVATMAALMLGLLIASANGSYDTQKQELMQMAANIAYLDRVLENYGPETRDARQLLRKAVEISMIRIWPENRAEQVSIDVGVLWGTELPKGIQKLVPKDDAQRAFKMVAAAMITQLGQTRWLVLEQAQASIPKPLLIVVIAWLSIIFGSIGLFAPSNPTLITGLMLAALCVSGAIFMIIELSQPFGGLISIPSQPMRNAVSHIVPLSETHSAK